MAMVLDDGYWMQLDVLGCEDTAVAGLSIFETTKLKEAEILPFRRRTSDT